MKLISTSILLADNFCSFIETNRLTNCRDASCSVNKIKLYNLAPDLLLHP